MRHYKALHIDVILAMNPRERDECRTIAIAAQAELLCEIRNALLQISTSIANLDKEGISVFKG